MVVAATCRAEDVASITPYGGTYHVSIICADCSHIGDLCPHTLGAGMIAAEMVGDFFVVSRWSGNVYGTDYEAFQSLGYDIEQKIYTGSWIDSFMSFRWELNGTVDEESQELTITTSGPAPTGGSATFRERYQFDSADSITIFGEMQRGEAWVTFTTTRLTRKR